MKAIALTIRLDSLYSIRIPYTWQSALAYPLPPPSTIIGMLTNALQRYKNDKPPLYYLDKVEENVIWAGARLRLLSPAVVKSYTTSAITKWEVELGGKSTNALGRQYVFTKNVEVVAVIDEETFAQELVNILPSVPITCGDSESIATVENIKPLLETKLREFPPDTVFETEFPIPFNLQKIEIIEGSGRLYLVHERCKKRGKEFPLVNYLFPLREENNILHPTKFTIRIKQPVFILEIEDVGKVISVPKDVLDSLRETAI
ncbi:CRISPR-associated protein Cas5 [Candidatus Aerophobetes bacterium]|nr:CRISPR-associated protein Cas5 [Candidatus Aerophobetes bacterium]